MLNMKSIISISLFSLCCMTILTANAGTNSDTTIKIQNCSQSRTQADIDVCRETAYAKSTRKLASLVKTISKNYASNEPKLKPLFLDTQERWKSFIKTECDFQNYYSRGGAGYNAYFLSCMELHTLKRTKQLEKVLATP